MARYSCEVMEPMALILRRPDRQQALYNDPDWLATLFSKPKNFALEKRINMSLEPYKVNLPGPLAQGLFREWLLYGFTKVSGEYWDYNGTRYIHGKAEEPNTFYTNNRVLAVADENNDLYVRPGDSSTGSLWGHASDGAEGSLNNFGYNCRFFWVPASNSDHHVDKRLNYLFKMHRNIMADIRHGPGERPSISVRDFSEPEPPALYPARQDIPEIRIGDHLFIPGNPVLPPVIFG